MLQIKVTTNHNIELFIFLSEYYFPPVGGLCPVFSGLIYCAMEKSGNGERNTRKRKLGH